LFPLLVALAWDHTRIISITKAITFTFRTTKIEIYLNFV
jgi:hypothetical protein